MCLPPAMQLPGAAKLVSATPAVEGLVGSALADGKHHVSRVAASSKSSNFEHAISEAIAIPLLCLRKRQWGTLSLVCQGATWSSLQRLL